MVRPRARVVEGRGIVDRVESIQLDAHARRRRLSRLRVGEACDQSGRRSGRDIGAAVRHHRGGAHVHDCDQRRLDDEPPAPQPAGSTIVWTATATGGTGPLVYKWFVSDDGVIVERDRIVDLVESIHVDAHGRERELSRLRVGQAREQSQGRMGSDIGTTVRDHRRPDVLHLRPRPRPRRRAWPASP